MKYAKLLSETTVSFNVPKSATIDGKFVIGSLPADYLASIGIYPYNDSEEAPTPQDGYHVEARYKLSEGEVVRYWIEVENPPVMEPIHVYSKLKILLAAREAGFADELIAFIESDKKIEYIWNASNTIEDNELLKSYLPAIAEALGRDEDSVREFLNENCVAD